MNRRGPRIESYETSHEIAEASRGAKLDELSTVFKITFKPIQSNVSNTIVLQIFTEYFMMSAIKRFRRVQKALKLLHFHQ